MRGDRADDVAEIKDAGGGEVIRPEGPRSANDAPATGVPPRTTASAQPGETVRLVGRDEDVAAVRAFVDQAAAQGGAMVICGDAGVGKSALVDAAGAYAVSAGLQLLRAAGAQFEANVSFAGLHQLLFPLLGSHLDQLDDVQRTALRSALGLHKGVAPDRMTISHAALELLTLAARTTPILIVVDDLPWLDQVSRLVLAFVARRTSGTNVGFLATERTGEDGFLDHSGIRVQDLRPLSDASSEALLDNRYPALSLRARRRLLDDAQGNPLALLELPIALTSQPADRTVTGTLPLTRRLQTMFAARIRGLPTRTRHALLLAVLDGTGDLYVLRYGEQGSEAGDLVAADRAHVIALDGAAARVSFRHPLIRSAVVELATDEERRRAHQILAERRADEPARRAWHLAEACTGPDEEVAALLQEVAHTNLFRGDSLSAITELLRAADISPAGTDRSSRLAEAAYLGAIVTGDLREVPTLMDAARRADPQHGGSLAGAVAGAYHLLNETGDIDNAHRLLVGAIEALPEPGDAHNKPLIEGLYTLLMVAFFGGRTELWPAFHTAVDRLRPQTPHLLSILANTFSDPARRARPVLGQLDALIGRLHTETSPARIVRTAIAGSYLDRVGDCREPLWRAVRHGREGGAVTSAIEALFLLGNDAYFAGRWDDVQVLTDEGIALCKTHNYSLLQWVGQFTRALVATACGDHATSRSLTEEMSRWAAPRRAGLVSAYAWHVKTLAALSEDDFDEAYRCAVAVSPAGELASHVPNALWLIMELVEAAARSGRPDEAAAHVAAARRARLGELSPRLALTVAGAAALAAADGDHRDLFEQALRTPDADRWPFDLARVRLAYGERLRRTKSPSDARVHLSAAADAFEHLGARPWATRAARELRATGVQREKPAATNSADLTGQQRQIAQLAAAGLSNKQIGERLFLSSRTVGYHLYQIFPKLGITSRAALRDALADLPDTGTTPPG
ncbi:LuxR family transcriptional regulator [Actinomadura sp. DC4]|uniref:helix-turn-helix transcriptional regulator n=1 Tax=Actinomadura sp. DC4 TaxID=3055069 RepID=UPI0025B08550|nr:LuxR family transcriptional regulator [Actinomadura sp. DC4]MDN3359684.1 AAA family ATPase [Actinomadura sp. DC4]